MNRLTLILAALLLFPLAGAGTVTEKKVFQANTITPSFGYEVNDIANPQPCPDPYASESCIWFLSDDHHHQYLGKTLTGGKHAYRLHWTMNEEHDSATSILYAVFSFIPQAAGTDLEGDHKSSGLWADSAYVRFHEGTNGWDVSLVEITGGSAQILGTATQAVDSSLFHTYDFQVNTNTQTVSVLDEGGNVLNAAQLAHHQGKAIASQWFMETGGDYWFNNQMNLRVGGDSTSIYDQDPRAPTITDLSQNPELVQASQAVQVAATIHDDWGAPTAVLHRWLNHNPTTDIAMTATGASFTGTLPGQAAGVTVGYQVEATGVSGLKARSDVIEYVVASGNKPSNQGGGSGSAGGSGLGSLTAIVFAILAVGGIAITLLDMASHPPGKAPHAYLYALLGVGLGIVWLGYANNKATVDAALAGLGLWVLLLLAAAVLAVALSGKRRPTP